MAIGEEKLDNPVWNSLSEVHCDFAIEYDGVKFYNPDYCPFGGYVNLENVSSCIDSYSRLCNDFYVVGDRPNFSPNLKLDNELVCNQMILETAISIKMDEDITELEESQRNELGNLVNLVQPGYFKSKTAELGNYYGIYKYGELVAVTGERMKMNSFTEVSAVVTHPAHTGKGYAKQLVTHAVNKIFVENKIPYLHVADTNIPAINLYEKLGFKTRRKISFWHISVKGE